MADYKPQNPEEHFALQRTTRAAEVVKAVFEAQQEGNEESRGRDERFYRSIFQRHYRADRYLFGILEKYTKPTHSALELACGALDLSADVHHLLIVLVTRLQPVHSLFSRMANCECAKRTIRSRSQGIPNAGA